MAKKKKVPPATTAIKKGPPSLMDIAAKMAPLAGAVSSDHLLAKGSYHAGVGVRLGAAGRALAEAEAKSLVEGPVVPK